MLEMQDYYMLMYKYLKNMPASRNKQNKTNTQFLGPHRSFSGGASIPRWQSDEIRLKALRISVYSLAACQAWGPAEHDTIEQCDPGCSVGRQHRGQNQKPFKDTKLEREKDMPCG